MPDNIKVRVGQTDAIKVIASVGGGDQAKNVIGGIASVTSLHVSGLSTFVGVGTFNSDLYIGQNLYVQGDVNLDEFTARNGTVTGLLSTNNFYVSGISTFLSTEDNTLGDANTGAVQIDGGLGINGNVTVGSGLSVVSGLQISGFSSFYSSLNVDGNIESDSLKITGITTLGVTTASQLYVSGISTLGVTTLTNATAQQLFVSGITTLGITTASQLQVSGITTLGVTTASQLYVSGVTTTTTLKVGENVSASAGIVTATSFSTGEVGTGINIGISTITGPTNLIIDPAVIDDNRGSVTIKGDLYVLGKETSISSQTIELADHRVGIATTVGTDQLLDGGGIGIGSTNILKTFTYDVNADALKSSVGLAVTSEGSFIVGLTTVLNKSTLGSGVTNSSLTSVGTLTQLSVIGVTTLGITTISQLRVGGATTFTGISTFSNNVNIAGTLTAGLIDGGEY